MSVTVYHLVAPPEFLAGGGVDVDEAGFIVGFSPSMDWTVGLAWVDVRRYYRSRGWRVRKLRTLPDRRLPCS